MERQELPEKLRGIVDDLSPWEPDDEAVLIQAADALEEQREALAEIESRLSAAHREGWPTGPAAALVARDEARSALDPPPHGEEPCRHTPNIGITCPNCTGEKTDRSKPQVSAEDFEKAVEAVACKIAICGPQHLERMAEREPLVFRETMDEARRAVALVAPHLRTERGEGERLREALEEIVALGAAYPEGNRRFPDQHVAIARAALHKDTAPDPRCPCPGSCHDCDPTEERCERCGGTGFDQPYSGRSCPDCTPTHSPTDAGGER